MHLLMKGYEKTMIGNYGASIAHIKSGSKVICEMYYDAKGKNPQHDVLPISNSLHVRTSFSSYLTNFNSKTDSLTAIEDLSEIFMRLDLQVTAVSKTITSPNGSLSPTRTDGWRPKLGTENIS